MRYMPEALAVLSLPAGAVGYIVTAEVLGRLSLGDGVGDIVMLFVPLFVAGLVMLPFLIRTSTARPSRIWRSSGSGRRPRRRSTPRPRRSPTTPSGAGR